MRLDHIEAAVGILAAVAHADGRLADDEAGWWRRVRRHHALFAGVAHEDMEAMLRRVEAALDATPWADAVAAWAQSSPELAGEVHALAVELLYADGETALAESDILAVLARALWREDAEE